MFPLHTHPHLCQKLHLVYMLSTAAGNVHCLVTTHTASIERKKVKFLHPISLFNSNKKKKEHSRVLIYVHLIVWLGLHKEVTKQDSNRLHQVRTSRTLMPTLREFPDWVRRHPVIRVSRPSATPPGWGRKMWHFHHRREKGWGEMREYQGERVTVWVVCEGIRVRVRGVFCSDWCTHNMYINTKMGITPTKTGWSNDAIRVYGSILFTHIC